MASFEESDDDESDQNVDWLNTVFFYAQPVDNALTEYYLPRRVPRGDAE